MFITWTARLWKNWFTLLATLFENSGNVIQNIQDLKLGPIVTNFPMRFKIMYPCFITTNNFWLTSFIVIFVDLRCSKTLLILKVCLDVFWIGNPPLNLYQRHTLVSIHITEIFENFFGVSYWSDTCYYELWSI